MTLDLLALAASLALVAALVATGLAALFADQVLA